jgi:hypothetical protein
MIAEWDADPGSPLPRKLLCVTSDISNDDSFNMSCEAPVLRNLLPKPALQSILLPKRALERIFAGFVAPPRVYQGTFRSGGEACSL